MIVVDSKDELDFLPYLLSGLVFNPQIPLENIGQSSIKDNPKRMSLKLLPYLEKVSQIGEVMRRNQILIGLPVLTKYKTMLRMEVTRRVPHRRLD